MWHTLTLTLILTRTRTLTRTLTLTRTRTRTLTPTLTLTRLQQRDSVAHDEEHIVTKRLVRARWRPWLRLRLRRRLRL